VPPSRGTALAGVVEAKLTTREVIMCHQVTRPQCSKPTWSGCGNHVEQALGGVAPSDRCACNVNDAGSYGATTGRSSSFLPQGR
jgi:hypothetical protein